MIMESIFVPFESIGLCFSGGGYRATFFSLGVVSYLDRIQFNKKPLLDNVEAISTVSGGTLMGVAFAKAAKAPDFQFDSFYRKFYNAYTAENDHLLKNAVSKLEDDSIWKNHPHKKRSLINAFALAYADLDIYKGKFETLKGHDSSNLKHICFNATEFSFGLAFRFQNTGKFGNNPLHCPEIENIKDKVELADVVASSSCFPMGFEPLVFPDDYFQDQSEKDYKALKRLDNFSNGVGIMDGGIVDNQGIGSMINISKSAKRKRPLDLIIVNDVGSYKMKPWLPESAKTSSSKSLKETVLGLLKYLKIHWIYWVTLLFGVSIIVLNSLELIKGRSFSSLYVLGGIITGLGFTLTASGTAAWFIKKLAIAWFKSTFRKVVPEDLADDAATFQRLDIGLIKRMLTERMTSSVKMVSEIFLKQMRRLNYNLIYSKAAYENKVITSTVYELNGQQTLYSKKSMLNEAITPAPQDQLISVAKTASEAPTTLWWDEKDIAVQRMDTLIACGQFTTCYNLMDYILKLKDNKIHSAEMDHMYKLLKKDWEKFNEDPLFMV